MSVVDDTSTHIPSVSFRFVSNDADLQSCCTRWKGARALALDTEFMRVTTFYPDAALFQVSDGTEIVLIDPLQIQEWQPFRAVLTDPAIVKILHSCSEDLLVFLKAIGALPYPLFDTQVAASMLEHGLSISYQNLVREYVGVELPKGETRSDWLQRPLTASQMEYAALDVAYLHQIWDMQHAQLEKLGRESWMTEECLRMSDTHADEQRDDFSQYFLNFKAAWQLGPQQLSCLQKLAEWRERRARIRNRPRSWIIKDTALLAIAQGMLHNKDELSRVAEISENFIRHEGDQVLALVEEARSMPEDQCPAALVKPLTQGQKNRLKTARELVEKKAASLDVSPEFLGRKKTLQALLYALVDSKQNKSELIVPVELRGWREPVILRELIGVLSA